jgi:chromosome segregation ATPase
MSHIPIPTYAVDVDALVHQVQDLKAENATLRAEIAQLQFDLKAARQGRDDYIDLMNQYRAQLADAQAEKERWRQAALVCDEIRHEMENVRAVLARHTLTATGSAECIEAKVERAIVTCERVSVELACVLKERDQLRAQLADLEVTNGELGMKLVEERGRHQEMEREMLARGEVVFADLNAQLAALVKALREIADPRITCQQSFRDRAKQALAAPGLARLTTIEQIAQGLANVVRAAWAELQMSGPCRELAAFDAYQKQKP